MDEIRFIRRVLLGKLFEKLKEKRDRQTIVSLELILRDSEAYHGWLRSSGQKVYSPISGWLHTYYRNLHIANVNALPEGKKSVHELWPMDYPPITLDPEW
jgi:hypothetical protein